MEEIDMWNEKTVNQIIASQGSIANVHAPLTADLSVNRKIVERLNFLKIKYATVFEIPQKVLLELAADRGVNIDQTQSQNCFMARPTKKKLNAYFFHAWELGLKTGMYYLRQKALTSAINYTLDATVDKNTQEIVSAEPVVTVVKKRKVECTDDVCVSCMV